MDSPGHEERRALLSNSKLNKSQNFQDVLAALFGFNLSSALLQKQRFVEGVAGVDAKFWE